ncbi:MAG TPA: HAMP domain-containing histidine kinase, partial [Candidatus Coprenecus stercoripullorum]|nr:HAMP domain-containing histidine kinase [Candidatus Coprenecus stercoripullorum]
MKVSLTQKIYAGSFLLLTVIAGMVVILIHERGRMREIDSEVHDLQSVRNNIHAAQLHITELSLLGESLISQENTDTAYYRRKRLSTDSLLLALKPRCRQHVRPGQIDTLRHLLADKETHLFRVVEVIGMQDAADSILVNHLPEVAERATRIRTVRKRRDNILGVLGAKKTVRVLPSAGELHTFSDSLIAMQQEGMEDMETSADSLHARNQALNARLSLLIKHLDRQAQEACSLREHKILEAQNRSTLLLASTLSTAILLLVLFHIAIHREIRCNLCEKKKREGLIDELQASNEKNRQLLQFRRNLMQTVNHELRTSLTAISGNAELLLRDEAPEDRTRHIRIVSESADRMASMTTELLEFFRLESRKEKLNIRPFRSESIAAVLETEFAPLAEAKGIEFVTDNQAAEVLGGDKERILRIGSNLLSNAVKFTRSGRITLHTDYKDGLFTLSVQDTGTGIRKEKQEQIFAPFERLGNAVTQDGFGLGLAIVTNLVQLMQGSASVESEPGKGSRFTVVL